MKSNLSIGLPRMHLEPGEKRDFLPEFVQRLYHFGFEISLEHDYGIGMGYKESDYVTLAPTAQLTPVKRLFRKI